MSQPQLVTEPLADALSSAELAFHSAPTDANWKAVTRARDALTQQQTRERIGAELAAKESAEQATADRAKKAARLAELRTQIEQSHDEAVKLGQRIGDVILQALPLIEEEHKLVDATQAAYDDARDIIAELGGHPTHYALSAGTVAQLSSDYVRSKMPEGGDPTGLSSYAGKWW